MNKAFSYFFDVWWRPIAFWFMAVLLVVLSVIVNSATLSDISLIVLGVSLVGLFFSMIYHLYRRKWFKAIIAGALIGGTFIAFLFFTFILIFINMEHGDGWADNLKLPPNVHLDSPMKIDPNPQVRTYMRSLKRNSPDFHLYASFQPGLYEYDFWSGRIEKGILYLKAFEITGEEELSTDRLSQQSSVNVYNTSDSIVCFGTTHHFTIYEGDRGKPYAARFEVWFKPEKGEERKLFQKNYKIEGWMF